MGIVKTVDFIEFHNKVCITISDYAAMYKAFDPDWNESSRQNCQKI